MYTYQVGVWSSSVSSLIRLIEISRHELRSTSMYTRTNSMYNTKYTACMYIDHSALRLPHSLTSSTMLDTQNHREKWLTVTASPLRLPHTHTTLGIKRWKAHLAALGKSSQLRTVSTLSSYVVELETKWEVECSTSYSLAATYDL